MFAFLRNSIIWIFLIAQLFVNAQELKFENLSNQLNLPTQEVYTIHQDSKGYIWFTSEIGLHKYNGKTVELIDLKSNFVTEGIYSFSEDLSGKITLVTSKQRVLEIINNQVSEAIYSKSLRESIKNPLDLIYSISKDENGNFIFNTRLQTIKYNVKLKKINKLSKKSSNALKINIAKNGSYVIKNNPVFNSNSSIAVYNETSKISKTQHIGKTVFTDWRNKTLKIGSYTLLTLGNQLIQISDSGKINIKTFPSLIIGLNTDKFKGLWIGLLKNGLYYYPNANDLELFTRNLGGFSVGSVLVDNENGIWVSTIEKGVFYCKSKEIQYYPNKPSFFNSASLLKNINNNLFISTNLNELINKNKKGYNSYLIKNKFNFIINDILKRENKFFISSNTGLIATNDFINQESILYKKNEICIYQMVLANNRLFCLSIDKILEVSSDKAIDFQTINSYFKAACLHNYKDSFLLIGGSGGLYLLNIKTKKELQFKSIKSKVVKIITDKNHKTWIATMGQGLFVLENNILKPFVIDNTNNPDFINDLTFDEDNTLWIASKTGLYKLRNKNKTVEKITINNGILSNNCTKIAITNRQVYLSTIDGICSFSMEANFKNTEKPKLYLSKINNQKLTQNPNSIKLKSNQKTIELKFDILSFKNPENNKLYYKLFGFNDKFITTNSNEIKFENLPPNSYKLQVFGINSDDVKSEKPIEITIEVEPSFYETVWFKCLISIIVMLILLAIMKKIISINKQKETEKTRINKLISDSKLLALQSQMNPHFIFNAINSIQKFILKNEKDEAYNYLSKFSKLIRMVLENSIDKTITLSKEIETLKLYIELEQLRFKNSFNFDLKIDSNLLVDQIRIPAMLIQPYVENAIWHGLMNMDNKESAQLKLHFLHQEDNLKICIEDNGIGREKSKQYKQENIHKPLGTSLSEKRIELLNNSNLYQKNHLYIEDLYSNQNEPIGTKVTIEIPLNF